MLTLFTKGEVKGVAAGRLRNSKARELAKFLQRSDLTFMHLLHCQSLRSGRGEIVVFQVEVELGQKLVYDIRRFEPIGVVFDIDDTSPPEVFALREDFPTTPHQNLRPFDRPRSLCLYEEPYSEIKLNWAALGFVERIREWLRLTARGELHQEDQPLEPLLNGVTGTIILPHDFLGQASALVPSVIAIELVNDDSSAPVYRLHLNRAEGKGKPRVVATVFTTPPIEHGVIHFQPKNLLELHRFCQLAKYDLLGELKGRIRNWIVQGSAGNIDDTRLVLVAIFPKKRQENGAVEYPDVWVFCSDTIRQIAVALEVEGEKKIGGFSGVVIEVDSAGKANDLSSASKIEVFPLRPVYTLNRARAAAFNGYKPEHKHIVAIGMGAIGSQVFNNLVRSGFGEWTLVDKDQLLPHNCARHALPGNAAGWNKGDALVILAGTIIDGPPVAQSIAVDIFAPGDRIKDLNKAFVNADIIFDFSASLAVARHLANKITAGGRRISVFLNPSGTDSIILREDAARKCPLTWLEMEYYRYLINEELLSGHLANNRERIRYARSCGDLSSTINQSLVALHAAIAGHRLQKSTQETAASIEIYRADENSFAVKRHVLIQRNFA